MTHEIVWQPTATNAAAGFLADDPVGLAALYEAVDQLAKGPRPAASAPYGNSYRRLRVGNYRVLYAIEDNLIRILVTQPGRTP